MERIAVDSPLKLGIGRVAREVLRLPGSAPTKAASSSAVVPIRTRAIRTIALGLNSSARGWALFEGIHASNSVQGSGGFVNLVIQKMNNHFTAYRGSASTRRNTSDQSRPRDTHREFLLYPYIVNIPAISGRRG
jgi:hypothetical protein